jgi:hypothetical protein
MKQNYELRMTNYELKHTPIAVGGVFAKRNIITNYE